MRFVHKSPKAISFIWSFERVECTLMHINKIENVWLHIDYPCVEQVYECNMQYGHNRQRHVQAVIEHSLAKIEWKSIYKVNAFDGWIDILHVTHMTFVSQQVWIKCNWMLPWPVQSFILILPFHLFHFMQLISDLLLFTSFSLSSNRMHTSNQTHVASFCIFHSFFLAINLF